MASKQKQPAQGQGRTANSEPRLQVFKGFQGCNFELSPRDFTLGQYNDVEQADLQMNFVTIQNNVQVESNLTLSTMPPLRTIAKPVEGKEFSGPAVFTGNTLYAVENGQDIYSYSISDTPNAQQRITKVAIEDNAGGSEARKDWTELAYYSDQLIALCPNRPIFATDTKGNTLWNTPKADKPSGSTIGGTFSCNTESLDTQEDPYVYGVTFYFAYVTKFGSTELSEGYTRYFEHPLVNWSDIGLTVNFSGTVSGKYITGVEMFFTVGGATDPQYGAYVDVKDGSWKLAWNGYSDITNKMLLAEATPPQENNSQGITCDYMTAIDSRMYFWKNNRIYVGGIPGHEFSVATGVGGGYCDVDPMLPVDIKYVDKYKTQSGADIVTMLCSSENSTLERRFNLVKATISLDNNTSNTDEAYKAEQVAGAVGCKSRHGGLVCADGLYSLSRFGVALTTLTMEYNSQIQTNYVSDPIKPVFLREDGNYYDGGVLLESDGVLYCVLANRPGGDYNEADLDKVIFCYDISAKAWWTYTVPETIVNMIHVDNMYNQEGICIICKKAAYLLPLTHDTSGKVDFLIETGELSTQMPQQSWQHLTQLEFRFDRFVGDMTIELIGIDQFGRRINTTKQISHKKEQLNLAEWMRVDLKLQSYKIVFHGNADFRLTHWIAKTYTMSNKQTLVYGFDDRQSYRYKGDIHPTFTCYNDIKKAIFV